MDERRMTADVELLPLPEPWQCETGMCPKLYSDEQVGAYAHACVAHATAAKDAEIEALRAEVAKSERSVEHTHQWYAVRLEKIKEVAKRVGMWSEFAAIIANGSSSIYDPPTYAQQLNLAKHEANAAEARAERLAEALRKIFADLRTLAGGETPDGDGVPVNVILWAEKRLAALRIAIDQARGKGVADEA